MVSVDESEKKMLIKGVLPIRISSTIFITDN